MAGSTSEHAPPVSASANGAARLQAEPGAQVALEVVAWLAGLIVALYLLGLIVTWVRLGAARLPGDVATSILSPWQLFGVGLRSAALTLVAFAVLSALAYLMASFRWEVNGPDWNDVVRKRGVHNAADTAALHRHNELNRGWKQERRRHRGLSRLTTFQPAHPAYAHPAPLGDAGLRIIAGFNILVLAGLVSLGLARGVQAILPDAWLTTLGSSAFLVAWLVFFLIVYLLLTRLNLLSVGPKLHGIPWVIVIIGALLASAPIGILLLTGVGIATFGRTIARNVALPRSAHQVIHSPLPWILLAIVALLSVAYNAMPPVAFPKAVVTTSGGSFVGGYLNRDARGGYFATCTPLANATSINERVRFVPAADLRTVAVGNSAFTLDSGDRPSLVSLGLRALSVNGTVNPPFNADLRPQRGTCGGAFPSRMTAAALAPELGPGVIVHSPATPMLQAHDGETPIQLDKRVPTGIAALARQYQPTLLVTAADRFWPVSVGALLADRGPHGGTTCLIRQNVKPVCGTALSASNLSSQGSSGDDYLQFPVRITHDPNGVGQFKAFQLGQYVNPGPASRWLADPGLLDPWYTAQTYFLLGPTVNFKAFPAPKSTPDPTGHDRFLPLEYWFYYPYNYFPLLANSELMDAAPVAADTFNVDFHQGDWEHIDVLLNAQTLTPEWLYLARHSNDGQFIQWGSPSLALDDGHPIVQAAIGGHPTYEPGCGPRLRNQPGYVLVDWLVCGSGRFAFRAATTPLVDIAAQPWMCWPGHFGAAGRADEIKNFGRDSKQGESVLDSIRGQVYVAGPAAPARQAENGTAACAGTPSSLETMAMKQHFTRKG